MAFYSGIHEARACHFPGVKRMGEIKDGSNPLRSLQSGGNSADPTKRVTIIGSGEIGGKAQGLVRVDRMLANEFDQNAFSELEISVPWFWIVSTDWFDQFMEKNRLYNIALSDTKDQHLANAFLKAELPAELVGELRTLIADVRAPLAVRSSSLLEDTLNEPFAGVYDTKMVPNNQFSADSRLRTLMEAIKFVYASTFSQNAKSYRQALGRSHQEEKMGVIIQEMVGIRHGDRFYPNISGVARSYNFYATGNARPEDGVVSLALGLGKTIVDGGRSWTYSPAHPRSKPPYGSVKELLTQSQTQFWSVNMGKPPTYDPIQETEYLFEGNLGHAEKDGVLKEIASTYDPQSDRLVLGIGSSGPRVLDFAPLLELNDIPVNDLIKNLMRTSEQVLGHPVEIEFAVSVNREAGNRVRFGFLQLRPMFVSDDRVEVQENELQGEHVVIASEQVLGNGQLDSIKDIVYVKHDAFSAKDSWLVAAELDEMNRRLLEAGLPYLLIVIGRLGTSDPWLGIPVKWGQVSGARVIVEASSSELNVDMSQGSHFFHNVTCLRILYFSADKTGRYPVRWEWLESQKEIHDAQFVRHVALNEPLRVKVDGESGRGVICCERTDTISD